jgi:hypothetical protein
LAPYLVWNPDPGRVVGQARGAQFGENFVAAGPWNFPWGWPVSALRRNGSIGLLEVMMRSLVGLILGCLLTVAAAYIHDTTVAEGGRDGANALVNWDVAAREWDRVKAGLQTAWERVQTLDDRKSTKSGA